MSLIKESYLNSDRTYKKLLIYKLAETVCENFTRLGGMDLSFGLVELMPS